MLNELFKLFQENAEVVAEKYGGKTLALLVESDGSGKFILLGNKMRDVLFHFKSLADATNKLRKYVKDV